MSDATNIWDEVPDWGGIGARRLARPDDRSLGASVWELQPRGPESYFHFHHGSQEMLVVLKGRPTVRLPDGDRQLEEGDVVSFPSGPEGAHGVRNDGDDVARVLVVSTNASPDVAEYPDTGKLGAIVEGRHRFFRADDAIEHAGPE